MAPLADRSRRLVGLGDGAAEKDAFDVGQQCLRPFPALFISQTGERVLGDDVLEVRHAHHPGHGLGGVVEDVGDN